MEYDYKQAHKSGETFFGPQPEGPDKSEIVDIIVSGLGSNGWQVVEKDVSKQPYKFILRAHSRQLTVYTYCWRISNGGRRRENEQRIQIGNADKSAFYLNNARDDEKAILLGIYRSTDPSTEPIIVAWETEKNKEHGASKSCFVTIENIAQAMRDGFVQTRDSDNNLICAFRKEFLNFYIVNLKNLHEMSISETTSLSVVGVHMLEKNDSYESNSLINKGENRIIYGAPGTGKSYLLNRRYGFNNLRVTFHPEYTYHDFVGCIRPRKVDSGISYEFVPGPFSLILKQALLNPAMMHSLIIEEINRANTAAVFGDLFQLLDRDDKGLSEYSIYNEELIKFLTQDTSLDISSIYIPSNLNIVATMNSADQGVFLMDSAFKRRWQFEYIKIDFSGVPHAYYDVVYGGRTVKWIDLVQGINKRLSELEINEDKHIGPYFISGEDVRESDKIASKLLIYLWDDVVRHNRHELFQTNRYKTFSELVAGFIHGEEVFVNGVIVQQSSNESETNE